MSSGRTLSSKSKFTVFINIQLLYFPSIALRAENHVACIPFINEITVLDSFMLFRVEIIYEGEFVKQTTCNFPEKYFLLQVGETAFLN